ncbi:ATP-binding protein [Pseudomonas sp. Marseille-QA0892]
MLSNNVIAMSDATQPPETRHAICDVHGPFEQKVTRLMGRPISSLCPVCEAERKSRESADAKARDAWERRRSLEQRLGAAAIPKRFQQRTLDQYRTERKGQEKALKACREFVNEFPAIAESGRCLMMLGTPGTGKTHLGAAIANQVISDHGATAVYRVLGDIFHAIRDSYGPHSEKTERQILAPLIAADLLVLDEIGVTKEQPSDFELRTLFSIINGRYEQCRPTIVISNLGVDEVKASLGERCTDRLREGGVIVLLFNWASERGVIL